MMTQYNDAFMRHKATMKNVKQHFARLDNEEQAFIGRVTTSQIQHMYIYFEFGKRDIWYMLNSKPIEIMKSTALN